MDIEKKKKRTASLRYKYEILVIVNYDNSTQLENIHDLDIVRMQNQLKISKEL